MKKLVLSAILLALVIPCLAFAEGEAKAGAGSIVLLGHIDFVGRYSAEDIDDHDNDDWPGYETYNLEHAVLGVAGRLGDNVDWAIVHAFAFTGPFGPINSVLGTPNNDEAGHLLDARIDWHLTENLTLTAGRFIPPTSMTWNPHLMKVLHTINYPLINNGGLYGMIIPSPMYQTGVMLTAQASGLSLQVGNFNGNETIGGKEGLAILGMNNTMDIDKTKGTAAKIAYDGSGLHVAGWYFGEEVGIGGGWGNDAKLDQWGAELAYTSDSFFLQGQYLSSKLDALDDVVDDDLVQDGWYALIGAQMDAFQVIYRYDFVNYDREGLIYDSDYNTEQANTIGVNYLINPNVTLGVNYVFRHMENFEANANEFGLILETNLF